MITNKYQTQTITETIEMGASAYTKALAASLQDTRNSLLRKLLDDAPLFADNHEIEVNFDGKE